MTIKVSVVIPVYNPGAHIEPCIDSLLGQTLPARNYEVIFVDDGSTDGTGERLDELAAEHRNVKVIHIPNSGWPGRPRNVGIDAARGKYIYFVDNDDWLGDQALERLYDRAQQVHADIVIGKVVGRGKRVPRDTFRANIDDATFDTAPLVAMLTPHKLFRRELLVKHRIRFPEGRCRLEDHMFVMSAYFRAERIAFLSDYPCYFWLRREDNASFGRLDPRGYYGNVRDVLDIVDANTEPGPPRDRLYSHWYRGKMLGRMGGRAFVTRDEEFREVLYTEVRKLALERFSQAVVDTLPCKWRVRSRLLREDRLDLLLELARAETGIKPSVELQGVAWTGSVLQVSATATMCYADGTPIAFTQRDGGPRWQPPGRLAAEPTIHDADLDVTADLERPTYDLVVRHRRTKAEYVVPFERGPVSIDGGRLSLTGRASLDPLTGAVGAALDDGVWDFHVRVAYCGWDALARLAGRTDQLPSGRQPGAVADVYRTDTGNVSLKVRIQGQRRVSAWRAVRALPGPVRRVVPPGLKRRIGRVLER